MITPIPLCRGNLIINSQSLHAYMRRVVVSSSGETESRSAIKIGPRVKPVFSEIAIMASMSMNREKSTVLQASWSGPQSAQRFDLSHLRSCGIPH